MITLLRHLLAIAVLPFTVTVIVPLWIARRNGIAPRAPVRSPRDAVGIPLTYLQLSI